MNVHLLLSGVVGKPDSAPGRIVYELARLRDADNPQMWWTAVVAAVVGLVVLVCYLYRRDTVELPRRVGVLLALLRCVALAGMLVFFLGIERRTTREVVHHSQVAVLIDVSQSMGLTDKDATTGPNAPSRMEQVVTALKDSPLVSELRRRHDVDVARFDRDVEPVVSLELSEAADAPEAGTGGESEPAAEGDRVRAIDQTGLDTDEERLRLAVDGVAVPVAAAEWLTELTPRGTETRLGDALDEQLRLDRRAPLAAVIVITDGVQNAGMEPSAAAEKACAAKIPIFPVGVGSTRPHRNLAVSDLLVPARAFPGDSVNITGYLQATGYAGRFVDVELLRRGATEPAGSGTSIASQRVQLGGDGDVLPVSFDLEPDEAGRFVFQLRTAAPPDDDNPRDNERESEMDVVDRETRVLLMASGPTREYRFLRDQLYRDATMKVDVLLQSAQAGISQDAQRILAEFPSTREALFEYDALVAFDPNWKALDAQQVELVETWVAEEAGGLIVVPGPIHAAQWIRSSEHAKLRDLYPVVFQQRFTLLDDGHFAGDVAWPLVFERAGREARFLWLGNNPEESSLAWADFAGVFGYYEVKAEKPGATVYLRVADPEAGLSDRHPVYMADQFYGAGRVLYVGSGEFWRLRALDPGYFETLYTKLVRHVSQGRLLRGSSRGALLVDRDRYELGETVALRARLLDERHQPLVRQSVTAQVVAPDGTTSPVKLAADATRPGMYVGQFAVRQEGTFQLALPLPGTSEEPFIKYIQVRVPELERLRPERNDSLLAMLANETGGRYYPQLELAAYGDADTKPLAEMIPSRAEVKLLKGTPDEAFAERQMSWLLGIVAGALFLEWIVRRVNRLA